MKKLLAMLLALSLLLSVTAVFAEGENTETAAAEEPVLLATINGEPVYSDNSYLNYVANYYMEYASYYGYDTSDPELLAAIRQNAMLYTLQSLLILQKAKEMGMDQFTDEEKAQYTEEAREQWAAIVEDYAAENITEDSSEEDKAAARADALSELMNMGYDEERYVSEYVDGELNDTMVVRMEDSLVQGKTVTDEEIQAYYDGLVNADKEAYEKDVPTYEYYTQYYGQSSYYTPEGYRSVIHILLPVEDELMNAWKDLSARLEEQADTEESTDAEPTAEPEVTEEPVTEEMVKAAEQAILDSVQAKVDEIKAKLAEGASFEDLIKEYGTDPGMQDDETRAAGYPIHAESIMYDPAFTAAAMKLEKIGDVGEPVVGQYGVHILKYLKDIQSGAQELTDEMKDEFRITLEENQKVEAMNAALTEWMAAAEIVYTEDGEAWKVQETAEDTASVDELVPED